MEHAFEDLVALERAAERERSLLDDLSVDHGAQWIKWRTAAEAFQAAVTEYAKVEGKPRVEVEMAAKKEVRAPVPAEV